MNNIFFGIESCYLCGKQDTSEYNEWAVIAACKWFMVLKWFVIAACKWLMTFKWLLIVTWKWLCTNYYLSSGDPKVQLKSLEDHQSKISAKILLVKVCIFCNLKMHFYLIYLSCTIMNIFLRLFLQLEVPWGGFYFR